MLQLTTAGKAAPLAGPAKSPSPKAPHADDIATGQRIRLRRRALGLSQTALADAIGVTFQQVQKYEKGINRVSGSRLIAIAKALGTRPAALLPPAADAEYPDAGEIERIAVRLSELADIAPDALPSVAAIVDQILEARRPTAGGVA